MIRGLKPIVRFYEGTGAEAARRFREAYPAARITHVDGFVVIGFCEVCGCPFTLASDFFEDSCGVKWCKGHGRD
jgi:hypothetical protein